MADKKLDPIFQLYDPIRYSFNKKKEDYIIISPTVGSKSQLNDGDYDSISGWIPDVGDGEVLKEPVRTVANEADEARMRIIARNTLERVARARNTGFENRVLQYNNVIENNRWGNYVNWKLYPLFGLLEHRKVSIGLPYKIHLQREINNDKIFFGENGSDAKLEITNLQLYIPMITPSIEIETRLFNMMTKDIEIAFLRRNTIGSMTLTGESTTWPITNTTKPARYLMVGFKNLPDSQTNNNNIFRVAMNQTQDPIIRKVQVRLNNENYPNQPLTINPSTKDYNELYRNYKNMCELFGNPPQFDYVDFAINHLIFCFDLSAHQEDLFKTGVNINIHIEKTQGDTDDSYRINNYKKYPLKMKPETLVKRIIEAIEAESPTTITYNGKKVKISKKLIDKYKHCKIRDDIDLERIDKNVKEGGFLPFLPLIFAGLAAAGATAGGAAGIASAVNAKKASEAEKSEKRRHNMEMEKIAAGSGVSDILGTVKEFGNRFSEETKKTVKQGLSNLIDKIDTGEMKVKHKGNAIVFKNIHSGEGIFLSKYKGDGVIFGVDR
ncbi:hypothetical protein LOTGIDRAFT_155887 [Lottia gigantea]|uniref:Double jelly roll-like domain-containing protein n=1 Tax=Lottia gigantea TaxID=225164 RepID=V3ZFK3_LOTGI|nr:hypothetical protein LOTGIDRAFT_155887 [Lottia gigantea]ESO82852.1 hypothetical protein LOTGIDRAFT_155887 [Lottia gigantea]